MVAADIDWQSHRLAFDYIGITDLDFLKRLLLDLQTFTDEIRRVSYSERPLGAFSDDGPSNIHLQGHLQIASNISLASRYEVTSPLVTFFSYGTKFRS